MIKCYFENEECELDQETIVKMIKRLAQKECELNESKTSGYNDFCEKLHSQAGECTLLVGDYKFLIAESDKTNFVVVQKQAPAGPVEAKPDLAPKILTSVGIVLQVVLFAILWRRMSYESI